MDEVQKVESDLYANLGIKSLSISAADPKIFTIAYDKTPESDIKKPMSDTPSRQEIDAKVSASAADTRSEFHELRADVIIMKSEVKGDLSVMRVEVADMRTEMRTGFAEVRGEMAKNQSELVKWFVGISVSMAGITIAALSFMMNANKLQAPTSPSQPIIINLPNAQQAPVQAPAKP